MGRGKGQSHRSLSDSLLPVGPLPPSKKKQNNRHDTKKNSIILFILIQLMFMVAIRLLMFSAGGGESKSMRFAGVSIDVLMMDGPGAPFRPVGRESAEVLSPAEVPPGLNCGR